MSYKCDLSKVGRQAGNRVSHSNNKTKHVFYANLQTKRLFVPELKKFVRLRVTTRVLRTIDKIGFTATLKKYGMTVADISA